MRLKMSPSKFSGLNVWTRQDSVDRLVQGRRNSIANALELRLSCTNPSMFTLPLSVASEHSARSTTNKLLDAMIFCR